MEELLEHAFTCPYCWETISMMLDLTAARQEYVEDCEVCCNPIMIVMRVDGGELTDFRADPLGQ